MTETPLTMLFVCDEWSPAKGGISVFNRTLAIASAGRGDTVLCLVAQATDAERTDAARHGVRLMVADRTPAGPDLHLPVAEVVARQPDVVVGHDHVTGHIGWLYARKFCTATMVHIIHTAPAEIEPYKGNGKASARVEAREAYTLDLAGQADVVAGVGPRLTRYATHLLDDGYGGRPVLRLDPGLDPDPLDRKRRVPVRANAMVLGRTGDIELKGLDIAGGAVAALPDRPDRLAPLLYVRGAPAEQCEQVRATLVSLTGLARGRVDVRPFSEDGMAVSRDLRRTALCLMPSRAEGFGLAAWEALAMGTPILVSAHSGVAELLREQLGAAADNLIVDITDDRDRDIRAWTRAVQRVFDDLPTAFAEIHRVRERLLDRFSWSATVAALGSAIRAQRSGRNQS
ncbi:glycosyltransferase family 4 protein [Micromonospora sp. WMMD975]|uniref:glycosyltransferase family 4 protein n=1 Tax=Micromonospora sp. WMMD975 TaxID=3016087 RepID=UPI00249CC52C|nr:glycosyltransferase family 4 protein [Micromonospora sp. WMMD975]WFE35093.1 glycosyltransferase family 4 protein [Micromonospora sp. WMMD975]